MTKTLLIFIVSTLFFLSCSKEDAIKKLPANLGDYSLKSLVSDTAMDLDYDGVARTDFKEELQLWWFSIPFRQSLIPFELKKSSVEGRYLVLTEGLPRDDHDWYDPDPSFRFKPADGIHSLYIENGEIISFEFQEPFVDNLDPNAALGQQRPYLIQFDSDSEVTMKFTQYFYDYITDEWIPVDLVARFEKVEL